MIKLYTSCLVLLIGISSDNIENMTCVKTKIAQNDTDLSCVKLDISVSKCFTKAQHFESLISSLIRTNQCHSELFQFLHVFNFLFCTGHVRRHLNFHGIMIKLFDIVFMFVMSPSILWIRSVSSACNCSTPLTTMSFVLP